MEVVYFVISVIEIILTVYLVFILKKAEMKVEGYSAEFEKSFNIFLKNFRLYAKTLKITSKIARTYKTYLKKTKDFKKLINSIKGIKGIISAVDFIKGKRNKKFNIFRVLRKIIFYI